MKITNTPTHVASGTVRRIPRLVRRREFDLARDGVYRARRFGPLHQRVWRTGEIVQHIDPVADFRRACRPPREGNLSSRPEAAGEPYLRMDCSHETARADHTTSSKSR